MSGFVTKNSSSTSNQNNKPSTMTQTQLPPNLGNIGELRRRELEVILGGRSGIYTPITPIVGEPSQKQEESKPPPWWELPLGSNMPRQAVQDARDNAFGGLGFGNIMYGSSGGNGSKISLSPRLTQTLNSYKNKQK